MSSVDRVRRKLRWTLVATVGAMSTGYIAAITVSTLAARAITGSELLAGIPSATGVISTAVGTSILGRVVVRRGRRRSLILGTLAATLGAAIAAASVFLETFPLLLVGMAVLGFGNAASHLSRYTAAELVEPARRGAAVSLVVWGGTIGAVVGPRLLDPAGRLAEQLGAIEYAGAYLATAVFMAVAAVILGVVLLPDPSDLAIVDDSILERSGEPMTARSAFLDARVQVALVAMPVSQFVMVLIMSGTPIHIENSGFGLGSVGNVISAHTLGMYAFAPVIGRLVDRVGARAAIAGSAGVLGTSAVLAATAPTDALPLLTVALFLLGIGWNLAFVAGSTMLSIAVEPQVRPIVQGRVDSIVLTSSALASAGSGVLLAGPGYTFLSMLAGGMVVCIIAVLAVRRQVPAPIA